MTRVFGWLLCGLLLTPTLAQGQTGRARGWEGGFHLADYSSLSLSGFGGAALEVEGSAAYGLSGAYNFTDHWAIGADLSWRSPDYRATFVPDGPGQTRVINASMDVARVQVKGIYYFLESNLTPFVELGYGWARIDSNILDRPPITGCWWDPWWGFICQTAYSTYTETKSTYGAAVGFRWDLRSGISLRGSLGSVNLDRARGVDNSNVETVQVDVLWRF